MRSILVLALFSLMACNGDEEDKEPAGDGLAIAGDYVDEWGTNHTITDDDWSTSDSFGNALYLVASFDNDGQYTIVENDANNAYNPGKYSRFDWVEEGGHLYYCQIAYDAPTAEKAEATPRADDSDPGMTGCGGYAWTNLTP